MTDDLITQIMNDIVTRLRVQDSAFRMVVGVNDSVLVGSIYSEAADEIERLRAELAKKGA